MFEKMMQYLDNDNERLTRTSNFFLWLNLEYRASLSLKKVE